MMCQILKIILTTILFSLSIVSAYEYKSITVFDQFQNKLDVQFNVDKDTILGARVVLYRAIKNDTDSKIYMNWKKIEPINDSMFKALQVYDSSNSYSFIKVKFKENLFSITQSDTTIIDKVFDKIKNKIQEKITEKIVEAIVPDNDIIGCYVVNFPNVEMTISIEKIKNKIVGRVVTISNKNDIRWQRDFVILNNINEVEKGRLYSAILNVGNSNQSVDKMNVLLKKVAKTKFDIIERSNTFQLDKTGYSLNKINCK